MPGKKKFILALDEGTTSCRAVLYSLHDMRAVCSFSEPVPAVYPFGGWVEQDADDIYYRLMLCVRRIFDSAAYDPAEVAAIGLTNQREAVVIWDRKTENALAPCIGWQCRRTAEYCEGLKKRGLGDMIKRKTGLVIDAYFSATKLKWLLDNTPGAHEKAAKGELLAGTLDSYLVYRMTGGASHITDVTNASRTMLFNINDMKWDGELLSLFGVPGCILPRVVECAGRFGEMSFGGVRIPVCGIAGDQQASLIGQACFGMGDVKCTYGTGAFILANMGSVPRITRSPLLTTVAYVIGGEKAYAFEGSVFNAGSVIGWLKDIGLLSSVAESEEVASGVEDADGVYLVPAFTGMGAPYWNMNCRASLLGMTRATTRGHIVRAGLESIALQCGEVYDLMADALGSPLGALRADGGASRNGLLLSVQADVIGAQVRRSREKESTSLGAAYLAGIGCGAIDGTDEIVRKHSFDATFEPSTDGGKTVKLKEGWKAAVRATLDAQ